MRFSPRAQSERTQRTAFVFVVLLVNAVPTKKLTSHRWLSSSLAGVLVQ